MGGLLDLVPQLQLPEDKLTTLMECAQVRLPACPLLALLPSTLLEDRPAHTHLFGEPSCLPRGSPTASLCAEGPPLHVVVAHSQSSRACCDGMLAYACVEAEARSPVQGMHAVPCT